MTAPGDDLFERYVDSAPSAQNAVDAVPGWCTALPTETGAVAGPLALSQDNRIAWMIDAVGGIEGMRILELGPLDGGHTAMLHGAGALRIDAVEANRLAFLRCLVTKNLLDLSRAHFHHGDLSRGLGVAAGQYDLVVASGVLYHLADPVAVLCDLATASDRLFLWTHVFDDAAMPEGDERRGAFTGRVDERTVRGVSVRLHERRYHGAEQNVRFCGGPRDVHAWPERADLMALLRALGYSRLRLAHDDPMADGGPALSILAEREGGC